jgi:hypothetical protein
MLVPSQVLIWAQSQVFESLVIVAYLVWVVVGERPVNFGNSQYMNSYSGEKILVPTTYMWPSYISITRNINPQRECGVTNTSLFLSIAFIRSLFFVCRGLASLIVVV